MKRIIAALALVLTLALPGMAAAEGTGMYLAPKFLMSIQSTGNTERTDALAGSGVDSYSQFTLGGAFALGYDFWPQQMLPLRAEIEFALRGNNEKTWSDGGQYINEVKGTWNSSTLFANLFWDFHNDTAFTPYVGAGLGMAFNYVGYDFTDNNGNKFSADDRFTNFAWNVGAGVAYNFNENFAVDASYRFVGLGYNEVSATSNGRKYEIGNRPYNNEFMVGLRFAF
ncbi:outer membrane protein [Desulfovibrio legallii]|jgi:outer membrane autotransporter protein|uniref:Porin family protein n=1 Tax=Desulfovibrio legallii TaxID=571438 RepID=A0A6H3FCY5_9BACT|nr:outer membrane beta-barrel protein [Desulfovibrio legallii]RHH23371.1 porin family protein [Desulfovibrio sp. AM18-2]TBH81112.1 porin family protein [Desulfovibrio legallii]CAI3229347.1 adhesin/virulence factor Hek [Desulfovibrio diazotrophicus]